MKWSHWASSPRVSTRVHTQKARKAATSMQTQWRVGPGRYAFHRIETLDSVAVNLNTGFVFVVCILSTWKKKKKQNSRPIVLKFHFFKTVLFFLTELQDVWILGESFCQNVSILYESSCSLEQLNLEGWCEPLVCCYVLCLCPEWKRCCGTSIAFHRSFLLRPSIGTNKRAILVEETVVTFSVLH